MQKYRRYFLNSQYIYIYIRNIETKYRRDRSYNKSLKKTTCFTMLNVRTIKFNRTNIYV